MLNDNNNFARDLWKSIDRETKQITGITLAARTTHADKSQGLLMYINRPLITWIYITPLADKLYVRIWEVHLATTRMLAEGRLSASNLRRTLIETLQKV